MPRRFERSPEPERLERSIRLQTEKFLKAPELLHLSYAKRRRLVNEAARAAAMVARLRGLSIALAMLCFFLLFLGMLGGRSSPPEWRTPANLGWGLALLVDVILIWFWGRQLRVFVRKHLQQALYLDGIIPAQCFRCRTALEGFAGSRCPRCGTPLRREEAVRGPQADGA